jgi:hypothetical protein
MHMIESVAIGVGLDVVQVLNEWTAGVHAHQLHAQTDAEHGHVRLRIQSVQERKLSCLPRGVHYLRLWVKRHAKWSHIDVITTRDHNPVATLKQYCTDVGDCR